MNLPNYKPGSIGYFHPSHNISPSKAAKMLVGVARSHSKGKPVKGKRAPIHVRSGRGLMRQASSLFNRGGGGIKK